MLQSPLRAEPQLDQLGLWFRCLGRFELLGERPRVLDSPRKGGREFLEYLVVHSHAAVSRETLIDALWPNVDHETGAHRLHVAVSGARHALRESVACQEPIQCHHGRYSWDKAIVIQTDVDRFEACYATGDLHSFEEGLSLYAGDFLANESADWIAPRRLALASKFVTMLERLAADAFERGAFDAVVSYASRLLSMDQAHEEATRLLMRTFARRGQRTFALAQYSLLDEHLERFLGVGPTSETRALRERIRKGEAD